MTKLSVHCTVTGTTRPLLDCYPKSGTKPYRLAPQEVIEILCLCVRHEHFIKTSKNFDKQLIIHSTHKKTFKIVFNSYQSI